jgi:hypothetical protein
LETLKLFITKVNHQKTGGLVSFKYTDLSHHSIYLFLKTPAKMLIAHELNLIFIHIPRTGGTTITNILTDRLGEKLIALQQHSNVKTSEGERLKNYPHLFKFGFVRNPWDRILSWYALLQ